MQSLSQTVNRKFIESFDASEWEVECEDGYVDVLSSNKTIKYENNSFTSRILSVSEGAKSAVTTP